MHSDFTRKQKRLAMENRELSWLQFNKRVQQEADCFNNPLLERAKFLAITSGNLDEFIQVRYQKIYMRYLESKQNTEKKKTDINRNPALLLTQVNKEIKVQSNRQYHLYDGIRAELYQKKICLYPTFNLEAEHIKKEKEIFELEIKPHLKLQPLSPENIKQKQIYLLLKYKNTKPGALNFWIIPLPSSLPRLYNVSLDKNTTQFIRLESIVKRNLTSLLPKCPIEHVAGFRVLRNQNFIVQEETQEDLIPKVKEMLNKRLTGEFVRLEVEESMSAEMLSLLTQTFNLNSACCIRATGPLDLSKLFMGLYGMLNRNDLKYPSAVPESSPNLLTDDIFLEIEKKDQLLYHPYQSFEPIVHLLETAAKDPNVISIKQTLYRITHNSPIATALINAAQAGKQVTVLMEIHARFDEENNLFWAERLTRAGCLVIHGFPMMKVHSKITFIDRKVNGETRPIIHLGTGNYHESTSKIYTDLSLLTADSVLCEDARQFFLCIEGKEFKPLKEIVKAPDGIFPTLLELIEQEKENALQGKPAKIRAKMNSLSDKEICMALLEAGKAGVTVELIVRGICCLKPEIENISENIHIRSIVGRYLEHARVFCFENAGDPKIYLSSSDWMPRNLYRRIELMFPVKDRDCKKTILTILDLQWNDTVKAYHKNNSNYTRLLAPEHFLDSQEYLLQNITRITKENTMSTSNANKEIYLYNSLTRKKELFVPINPGKVGIYACGPTVYNFFHIGNARPFIVFDVLRRYFAFSGYDVTFVQNFTDIDDKLIRRANEENTTVEEIAERYIQEYYHDANALGIEKATVHPRATEHIPQIIDMIQKLIDNGLAYQSHGDVYFRVKAYPHYGCLCGQNLEDLESGARISVDDLKEDPLDFVLWKAQKPGEPAWESPFGMGRPGWHIECSAMSTTYLGDSFDIHTGGKDLLFPHHENEIAQSAGATGQPYVRYWLHNGFINIDNEKMSKSKGNFFTVRDIAKEYDLEAVRMFMLSAHYRSPINFSRALIEQAAAALKRLYGGRDQLLFLAKEATDRPVNEDEQAFINACDAAEVAFISAMNDDMNTADAIAALFTLVTEIYKLNNDCSKIAITYGQDKLSKLTKVLGLLLKEPETLPQDILDLVNQRQVARQEKNWALSDQLRDEIIGRGYILEDTKAGQKVRKGE